MACRCLRCEFAKLDNRNTRSPNETTILRFRYLQRVQQAGWASSRISWGGSHPMRNMALDDLSSQRTTAGRHMSAGTTPRIRLFVQVEAWLGVGRTSRQRLILSLSQGVIDSPRLWMDRGIATGHRKAIATIIKEITLINGVL